MGIATVMFGVDAMFDLIDFDDDNTAIMLPPPSEPTSVAEKLVELFGLGDQLVHWRGEFYRYCGRHWEPCSRKQMTKWVRDSTKRAMCLTTDGRSGEDKMIPWNPTVRRVTEVMEALAYEVYKSDDDESDDYLDGLISFSNVVFSKSNKRTFCHLSTRFNLHSLPVAYDPSDGCPEWLKFLDQALDMDEDRIELLREWFGYILFGDTRLHKILVLWGAPRSGKGTILRVLTDLIGERFVTSPRLATLGKEFGLKEMIGKPLATLCDVKWDTLNSNIEEVLLTISGGDKISISRKYLEAWEGYLPTRIVMASNDMPNFANTSGALGNRMVILRFLNSFIGREDLGLGERLRGELSGIFNWALAGWESLSANRMRFTTSAICSTAQREVITGASPVTSFLEDVCAKGGDVDLAELYREYMRWRSKRGMREASGEPAFSRALQSAYPLVTVKRAGSRGARRQVVNGIHLANGDEEWGEWVGYAGSGG